MKIIFYGLWLITIVAGSTLGTLVPPSAVYLTGFTAGNLSLMFCGLVSIFPEHRDCSCNYVA